MAKILSYAPLNSNPQIYMPSKLLVREEQLIALFKIHDRIINGFFPSLVVLSGDKATGKSVTVRHFVREMQARDFPCVFLSCKSTLKASVKSLLDRVPQVKTEIIDNLVHIGKLIFFDDVQNVNPRSFNLEIKHFYDNYKSIATPVFITNISLRKTQAYFTDEVLSRMSWPLGTFINFPPYSLNDMYHILIQRCQEALEPNSWDNDAVLNCAKYGAENKDIRLAIDVLRDACEYRLGEPLIVEHVDYCLEKQGVESLSLDLDNLRLYERIYLLSQTIEEEKGFKEEEGVFLGRVDSTFENLSKQLNLHLITRQSRWRLRQKLELEQFIDIATRKYRVPIDGGKARAGTSIHLKLTIPSSTLFRAFKICSWDDLLEPQKIKSIISTE